MMLLGKASVGCSHPLGYRSQQLRLPCVRRCKAAKRVTLLRAKDQGRPERPVEDWQQSSGPGQEAESYQAARGQEDVPPPPWARQSQEYYQSQYPHGQNPYAPPPAASSGGVPWKWVVFGIIIAWVYNKVTTFLFTGGGPQAKMMGWMMKQAMAQATKQQGGPGTPPPGFPDFSKMGSPPGGFPGAFPGSGFPGASSPPSSSRSSAVYDMQAKSVEDSGTRSSASAEASRSGAGETERPGARFQDLKGQEEQRRRRRDTDRSSRKAAAFVDVDEEEAVSSSERSSSQGAQNGSKSAFEPTVMPPPGVGSSVVEGAGGDAVDMQLGMLDQMLQDPQMQELLFQHLPEPMRNKETMDWMLKNEDMRAQLKATLKQQGATLNPEVFNSVQNMSADEVQSKLAEQGLTPADVLQKIMSEPELAAAFSKPQVQQAIMDLQTNPMAIVKYQDDPDVMLVFEKMATMFPQMAGGSMPPGM